MKSNILYAGLFLLGMTFVTSCEEKPFGEDYDVTLPVSTITVMNPVLAYVDDVVALQGENLDAVTTVSLDVHNCEIIAQTATELKFKVNRSADRAKIVLLNKYKRTFESEQYFTPLYYDVKINRWPSKLERGKMFNLEGENVDLLTKVKIGGKEMERSGKATPTKVTYSLKDVTLADKVTIEVTSKTGQVLTSPEIEVVEPTDVFEPATTILLFDFDGQKPVITAGNPSGAGAAYTAGENLSGITPAFGSYWTVKAPLGNAWNGIYQELKADNNGEGFDLSGFARPYITFLVNTNGKQGYCNPKITIGGNATDKHFTGQSGEYTDNYKFKTNGWEWRSYDLEAMGYTGIKGKVDAIELLVRGANIGNNNTEEFELNIDQVMITDGPLNPSVMWNFETLPTVENGSGVLNGGSGVALAGEGSNYLTMKAAGVSKWQSLGIITQKEVAAAQYSTSMYINFLVNTGNSGAEGYMQLIFNQNNSELGKHFKASNPYGDDYKFASTQGKWQWRSYKIDPTALEKWKGDATVLDLNAPFDFSIEFKTGNVAGNFEMNLDYVMFSSVPLDSQQ